MNADERARIEEALIKSASLGTRRPYNRLENQVYGDLVRQGVLTVVDGVYRLTPSRGEAQVDAVDQASEVSLLKSPTAPILSKFGL